MKKTLSLILSVIIALTSFSFCTSVYAAVPAQCAVISIDGVENNSLIDDALSSVNNARVSNGLGYVQLDSGLTELAKQRAKEIMVFYDSNDLLLPNGDSNDTVLQNCTTTLLYRFSAVPAQSDLNSCLSSESINSYNQYAVSMGIGFFTAGNVTTMYVIYSLNPVASVYQNFNDAVVKANIQTLASNIQLKYSDELDGKKPRYLSSVNAYFPNGCVSGYVPISLDQVTIKSSKPSVAKYKKGYIYPKKNGVYTVSVVLNSNPSVTCSSSYEIHGLNNPKVSVKSVKSTSKKKATVKWKNNISDASGYEIKYSTSNKFTKKTTKTVTVKGKKKNSKTIDKLKSKKNYYVKVRFYIEQGDGERIYGAWSKTIKVKVK